jgi:hypothetical protein
MKRCLVLWWLLVLLGEPLSSFGGEAELENRPAPASVDQIVSPTERSFSEKPKSEPITERFRELLRDLPPFLRDTELTLKPRTYYFLQENPDKSKSEAWAGGGSISYDSGWLLDRLAIGAELFTSQKLYGPADREGTLLLEPGQKGYTVLGQAFAKLKLADDHVISTYRQEYNTPYVNQHDSRMTPNTFEGYSIQGRFEGSKEGPSLKYGGGYITEIKERDSDHFISMSEAAGTNVTAKRGVATMGGLFSVKDFSFGAVEYYISDILNILYGEAKYKYRLADGLRVNLAAQFTDQRSVGDHLLTGSFFDTQAWGLRADVSYGGAVLGLAFTSTSNEAAMQSPWGAYPGYTKSIIRDFDQAGENAFLVRLSYDFKGFGLDGLSAFASYVRGWDVVDPSSGKSLPGEEEFDVTADYRPKKSLLGNLWLRVRGAFSRQMGSKESTKQLQVILNHEIPLL